MATGKNIKAGDVAADMAAADPVAEIRTPGDGVLNGGDTDVGEEVTKACLVICAFPDTGEVMDRIWRKMCPDPERKMVAVSADMPRTELLANLVADDGIADDFIFIPAGCVPCAPVSFEELHVPFVFKDVRGGLHYAHDLPVPVRKDLLVDVLGADATGDAETVMKKYLVSVGRPVVAAFREGNIVTPVLRGNPCENVVMEAVLRKKYIVANPAGFAAIRPLLMNALLR